MSPKERRDRAPLLTRNRVVALTAIVALAIFAGTLAYGFVWDDQATVLTNREIRTLRNLPALFGTHAFAGTGQEAQGIPVLQYYRPVWTVSLALDHALWQERAAGYHFTNIFLHALATGLVAWIAWELLGSALVALIAGLLFALHPAHVEAVAWISARNELLCTVFVLLSFAAYIRWRRGGGLLPATLAIASFGLALLSKESAIVLPGLVLLYEACLGKGGWIERCRGPIGLGLLLVPYELLRSALVSPLPVRETLATRLATAPDLVLRYLELLLVPFDLRVFHSVEIQTAWGSASVLLPALLVAAIVGALVLALRFDRTLVFGLGWTLIALAPFCGIGGFPKPALIAERYLYLPSAGLALAGGALFGRLWGAGRAASRAAHARVLLATGFAVVFVVFAAMALLQSPVWRSDLALMSRMTRDAPDAPLGHLALGLTLVDLGRLNDAASELLAAVRLGPNDPWANLHLGEVLSRLGRPVPAARALRNAVALGIPSPKARLMLGATYEQQGMLDEAERQYLDAIQIAPDLVEAHAALGLLYYRQDRLDDAERVYRAALRVQPNAARFRQNLGGIQARKGHYEAAIDELEAAVRLDPALAEAWINLGATYAALRRNADAERALRTALALAPSAPDAHLLLGKVLIEEGRANEAVPHFRIAFRDSSADPSLRRAAAEALARHAPR